MAEPNAAVVRRAVEAIWNRGELAVADDLFAPGYVNHGGLIPDLVRGPEAIKVGVAFFRAAFPTLHVTVKALSVRGELVMLRWAAHRAPPGGAPAGSPGGLTGTTRSRVVGGRIAESWTEWDRDGALRGLGLLPPPEAG